MLVCPACAAVNRPGARFCLQCASALAPGRDQAAQAWLAATLGAGGASNAAMDSPRAPVEADGGSAPQPAKVSETTMEQSQPQNAPPLFGGRYELVTDEAREDGRVEAIDRRPWERCWACGATSNEPGELFCTECGASLDGRRYTGHLSPSDAPTGLALVSEIDDEVARAVLPPLWDQVTEDDKTLTLVAESTRPPLRPPLEELDALRVGYGMARLLAALHARGLVLGPVEPGDLELAPSGMPQLRDAPGLERAEDAAAATNDLAALGRLLEALTATPRTTKRLADDQIDVNGATALPDVLRALRTGAVAGAADLAAQLETLIAERTEPRPLWTRIGAASHAGMVRPLDEDSLLALDLRAVQNSRGRSWGLFIVADGMGGHAAGEVASGLAIRGAAEIILRSYLAPTLETDALDEEERMTALVRDAVRQANEYVARDAEARGNDMGTTITMALVAGDRAIIGNVGDSRTYLFRDGALKRITKDHSLVMRLVELGQISEDEIYTHPQRNAVLRSLGDRREVEADTFSLRLRPGDALLLCCDGQWEMTRDDAMARIIAEHDDPQAACEALIAAANEAGGEDNITSVLVRFEPYEHASEA